MRNVIKRMNDGMTTICAADDTTTNQPYHSGSITFSTNGQTKGFGADTLCTIWKMQRPRQYTKKQRRPKQNTHRNYKMGKRRKKTRVGKTWTARFETLTKAGTDNFTQKEAQKDAGFVRAAQHKYIKYVCPTARSYTASHARCMWRRWRTKWYTVNATCDTSALRCTWVCDVRDNRLLCLDEIYTRPD